MILGIDYGLKNIGLATSEGKLAAPAGIIQINNPQQALTAIRKLVEKWSVNLIIVGISEGKSKTRAVGFGNKLKSVLRLPVEFVDETLSTVEAGATKRGKRHQEHAKAAAIILQRWLDNN